MSTYQSSIYQKKIEASDHEFIFKDEWQLMINNINEKVKLQKDIMEAEHLWRGLIDQVKHVSIDSIIIACTNLNVLLEKEITSSVNIVDSAKSLAQAVVRQYLRL